MKTAPRLAGRGKCITFQSDLDRAGSSDRAHAQAHGSPPPHGRAEEMIVKIPVLGAYSKGRCFQGLLSSCNKPQRIPV